jgi:hypothetical protein
LNNLDAHKVQHEQFQASKKAKSAIFDALCHDRRCALCHDRLDNFEFIELNGGTLIREGE